MEVAESFLLGNLQITDHTEKMLYNAIKEVNLQITINECNSHKMLISWKMLKKSLLIILKKNFLIFVLLIFFVKEDNDKFLFSLYFKFY